MGMVIGLSGLVRGNWSDYVNYVVYGECVYGGVVCCLCGCVGVYCVVGCGVVVCCCG